MANTISLDKTVNTDDTATVTDETSFSSPLRTAVGVYISVYKMSILSVGTLVVSTGNDEDPQTDTEWTFSIDNDGWYQVRYVAVPDYNGGTAYITHDAVQDPVTSLVYKAAQASTGQALANATYWTPVTDPSSLALNEDTALESTNMDTSIYNMIIFNKVDELLGDVALEAAGEEQGVEVAPLYTESDRQFAFVDGQRYGAEFAETRQQFAAAERYIRRLDDFVEA